MATILLVEEYPSTREAIRALLEQDAHTVLEAGTALEALTVAAVAPPDLILLDMRLPDAHGFDVAQRLRVESRMASVPILGLIAYAGDQAAQGLAASGCTGYLTKPIIRDLLPTALQY